MFRKILLSLLGLIVLAVFLGTAWFLYAKSQEKPIVYETTTPFRVDIVKKTVATGKIQPRKEVEIKPQVSGVVDTLFVEAGDILEKGDLIARIQIIPNMERLNNAESNLERAQLNLDNANIEYSRQKKLFKDKLISAFEFRKFELDLDIQKENVRSAENNVDLIKDGASKKSGQVANLVRSTVSGMVLNVPVKEGTFVTETNTFNQGTTVANIANMKDLVFVGKLDESEVGKIKEGMTLILDVGALNSDTFSADLEYISPKGTEDQGTIKFEIKAAIQVPEDQFLRAGYSANADIVLEKKEDILAINESHLIIEDDQTYVEIETGDQAFEKHMVEVGISDGINIEIVSGLDASTAIKKRSK